MNKTIGVILLVLITLLLLSFYFMGSGMMTQAPDEMRDHSDQLATSEVGPGQVVQMIRSSQAPTILDLRTEQDYQKLHVQGALLLPAEVLSQKTLTQIGLGPDAKDASIILYDRSGAASKTARKMMEALGYTNVQSVSGGITHWKEDSFPLLEQGAYTGPTFSDSSNAKDENASGPRITLTDDWYDFGVIPQFGGVVEKTFTVTNTGTEVLTIGDLTTSCSCASADISTNEIAPGEQATLTVYFDPDFHAEPEGVFTRTVFIPTNDPNNPEAEVTIQVDIAEGT